MQYAVTSKPISNFVIQIFILMQCMYLFVFIFYFLLLPIADEDDENDVSACIPVSVCTVQLLQQRSMALKVYSYNEREFSVYLLSWEKRSGAGEHNK